jgi:clorobiocin biosynthesis protein CloN5
MELTTISAQIREFIGKEVLDGNDSDLNETTPLLEWGVLNSFETVRLRNFIKSQFQITVPNQEMNAANLTNIETIAKLVARYLPS